MISRNVRADRMWLCQGDSSCDVNATRDVKGALRDVGRAFEGMMRGGLVQPLRGGVLQLPSLSAFA